MIHLDNLTKQYDLPSGRSGEIVAADRLSLQVADREIFGVDPESTSPIFSHRSGEGL
jgi:hypothetical protein